MHDCNLRHLKLGLIIAATLLLATVPTFAGGDSDSDSDSDGGHRDLSIAAVFVNFAGGEIEIVGQDLDFGHGPLEVTLAGLPLTVTSANSATTSATATRMPVLPVP